MLPGEKNGYANSETNVGFLVRFGRESASGCYQGYVSPKIIF